MERQFEAGLSDATAPLVRREREFSADLGAMESIPGWRIQCLQVSRGELAGHSVDLHLPSIQLLFEEYRNVATNHFGCGPEGTISFGVARSMQGAGMLNGIRWSDGFSAFDTRRELDSIVMPTQLISIVVDRRLLSEYLWHTEHADIEHWLSDGPAVANDASLAASLSQRLRLLVECTDDYSHAMKAPAMRYRLQQSVMELLGSNIIDRLYAARSDRSETAHFDVVRRARDHLRAHRDDPPSIGQLCLALGVSRRWLQLSFNEVLQISPHAYLRAMRLGGARRLLAKGTAGVQVKDAVEAFGFWHLSRFSHDYRGLFGELPSETLRRARLRA
jgi:AraC family transcriptional regulator, ethanolamine operon transcriptional activator